MIPKGTLIAIGGAEDKGLEQEERYTLNFGDEGILSHVVSRSGGDRSNIVVITSASSIPLEVGDRYRKAFRKLGCENIKILPVQTHKDANSHDTLSHVERCDAIMFSGGDQSKLSRIWRDSFALEVIRNRYVHENFVIAGTSAGAVSMSKVMITGGSSARAMLKGAVKTGNGLGFIDKVIFDSHFIQRGRFGRLTEAVALSPDLLGIGLGEDTGFIIENGNEFTTIGSGMVLLFDASKLIHNSAHELSDGTPISISNMKIHVLANSDKYYLKEGKVEVLPIDANFI